jgi:exodeoxyribonuclease V beta subunit
MNRQDPKNAKFVVDPDRHAVIEASAGTGKTHTLVELVTQLLLEKQVPLEKILLVTFTEKATGELKERLRETLENLWRERPKQRCILQAALDCFDSAHVHTIHGFCQRVLQEYAFEHGQEFRAQLVHDTDLLRPCLCEVQRTQWRNVYGDSLAAMLGFAGYGQDWEALVLEVARHFRPTCGNVLRPEPCADLTTRIAKLNDALRVDVAKLCQKNGCPDPVRPQEHPWWAGFTQLDFNAKWREARQNKVLLPLLQWLGDDATKEQPLAAFLDLLRVCQEASSFSEQGFQLLSGKLSAKARAQLSQLCPGLQEAVEVLEQWRQETESLNLPHQLAVGTVPQLQAQLAAYKRESGLQSFEDLLTRIDEALDPKKNPQADAVLAALRTRFTYAVVDEFQDTDPLQWHIFKRLFVEGDGLQRLFVVGDPKQAIFGFRGADLCTYQAAAESLCSEHKAEPYPLKVNWRSSPELLEALNSLFGAGGWFDDTGIAYSPVHAPDEKDRRFHLRRDQDQTGRAALSLVDLSSAEKLSQARRQMAGFIAHEIRRLLIAADGKPRLEFKEKESVCSLGANDICILVARRREAAPVLEALRAARIPYTFYKQTGLWQSAEALHLGYVLRALARSGDVLAFRKALLTQFFRVRPEVLSCSEELPSGYAPRELFLHWCGLARERRWAELFQSLLEDTGLLFHVSQAADADRRRANYSHLCQTLAQVAYGQDLDLLGVLDLLEQQRNQPGEDDSDIQPLETDRPKVRIMTIHAAKGLEFPVVFLAGGYTQGRSPRYLTYRDEKHNLVFDLCTDDPSAKEKYKKEREAEQCRLYYVALTRAMFKLYVPYVPPGKNRRQPGPVVTRLAPAIENSEVAKAGSPIAEEIKSWGRDPDIPASQGAKMEASPAAAAIPSLSLPGELFPQIDPDLSRRRIRIRSFTSLHRRGRRPAPEGPSYAEGFVRAGEEPANPLEEDPLRGAVFGEMAHAVLEEVDFAQVGQAPSLLELPAEVRTLIEEVQQRYWPKLPTRFSRDAKRKEECRQELGRMVWNGLQTPLGAAGCRLCEVPRQDRLHELEFHFPQGDQPAPTGACREEDFLTGFMDLVFRRAGRFFLVDWKTNYLRDGYSPEEVARSVRECDYVRQYRLYVQALVRWFQRSLGSAFDFERHFGGVYYLYLRGMNGLDESAGVFFYPPTAEDLQLERVLGNETT